MWTPRVALVAPDQHSSFVLNYSSDIAIRAPAPNSSVARSWVLSRSDDGKEGGPGAVLKADTASL